MSLLVPEAGAASPVKDAVLINMKKYLPDGIWEKSLRSGSLNAVESYLKSNSSNYVSNNLDYPFVHRICDFCQSLRTKYWFMAVSRIFLSIHCSTTGHPLCFLLRVNNVEVTWKIH
jgi:hypothetical protein